MTQEANANLQDSLLEFVDDHLGIWIYDSKTNAEVWTKGLETLLQIGARDGRSLRDVFPDINAQIEKAVLHRENAVSFDLELSNPVRLFSCDLKIRYPNESDSPGIVSAEIRRRKDALASPNKTLRNIFTAFAKSPEVVVFMTDAQGRYTLLDGSGLQFLGIVQEEWLGRSVFEFLGDYPEHVAMIERIFQGDIILDESRFGKHTFEDRLFPVLGEDGELVGIAGIQINITDKVRIQEELQASIDLLNNLFDSIPDNAYVLDLDYNILRINAAARATFPDEDLLGCQCFKTIHGRTTPCEFCPVIESFQTGRTARRIYFETKRNCFYELTSFPIRDHLTGEIIGATEFARDITDRKRMEESLLRNQSFLDDLLEILDEAVYLIDTNYTVTRANKVIQEMYPELHPIVGRKCYETTVHGCVCPDCAAASMFREGKAMTRTFFEKNNEDQPGYWLELNAFPLYDHEKGEINGAICIVRDVTPRIEMESQLDEYRAQLQSMAEKQMRELRLSEAKLRSILETSGAAISFADFKGRYTYVNTMFKEMFGYTQEEVLGKMVTNIVGGDAANREMSERLVRRALQGELDTFRQTLELVTKNGTPLWADISVNVIRGIGPEEAQFISVILDVTAQQELLDQLDKARIAAEDASREKSQFLATMSHEIRTPLNGVIGISNLLMETPLQPKQLEYAKLVKASGESLLFLINDILDFSKIEAGKFELVETEFNIYELVESVLGILASRADEKDLDLIATFDNRVPGPLKGDPGRLRQVLINLAGNALKFTEEGGVRLHIELDALLEHGVRLRFEVIDTGIGIPEERQDRLFRQFSQVDSSSTRAYGGTGLGLAISKKLIELMGGEVHVESVFNEGSNFWFTACFTCTPLVLKCMKNDEYPCITEKRDYCRGIPPSRCARSGREVAYLQRARELKGVKTLLIGTGKFKIPILIEQLNDWKMRVETVSHAPEALPLLQKAERDGEPFRLVIIDFMAQDPEDEKLLRAIQDDATLQGTAIVALASLSDNVYKIPWRFLEKIRFVTKPVCCSVLLDAIVRLFFELPGIVEDQRSPNAAGKSSEGDSKIAVPIRVLVAEDNKINQIVIVEILRNAGMMVSLAVNGEEAVRKSREESYDVILMDCQMPIMDGYDATAAIRERETKYGYPSLPIIALTANATSGDETKCLQAGMNAYCSKPVSATELINLIYKWTNKSG